MKRSPLSEIIERGMMALLPALTAYALLAWYAGSALRIADAAVLASFSVLLALSAIPLPDLGPVCFSAIAAALTVFFTDRPALLVFFRALLSGAVADGSRSGLLLCAGAVGLLGSYLLRYYPLRAAASLVTASFWVYAAFRFPLIPKLAFAAAAPILLFTLCETVARLRGIGTDMLKASGTRLLLFCLLSLVLLLALPSSEKPYPYPLYNAVRSRIVQLFERVETQLLYRRSGDAEFSVRFDGYTEEASPDSTVIEDGARVILIQPGPDTGGVFYLAGSSFDSFDGANWSSTVDRELVDTLGWNADAAERLYALWRIRQGGDTPLYVGENSLYLHYRDMDVRTLFTSDNTYFIRSNPERYPFRSQPSKVLFDYLQDREAWYRLFLLRPYASRQDLLVLTEGYDYDENGTLQWNSVLQDFDYSFGVDVDRAAKVEPFLARRESFIRKHFLSLPSDVSDELRALAVRITSGCETDSEKLAAIESYLQTHYSYTRTPGTVPAGKALLDYLLFESKEGYCTWYASAAAVLGRLSGVPTRYVQGFRVDLEKGKPDLISSSDSHAWCEGYIAGYGWVTVDATPGFGVGSLSVEETVIPNSAGSAVPLTVPGVAEVVDAWPQEEPAPKDERRDILPIAACALAILLLTAAAILFLRVRRARRVYEQAGLRERVELDLKTLLGYLSRRGYPRQENESLRRFFSGVRWHYLLDDSAPVERMLKLYEDVLFGGKLPSEEEWLEQRQFVESLRPRRKK